jgi:hypothetical protein
MALKARAEVKGELIRLEFKVPRETTEDRQKKSAEHGPFGSVSVRQ